MKGNEKNRVKSHLNSETVKIGTVNNPSPIYLDLWNISEALRPEYWTNLSEAGVTYESLGISQKKKNLEGALADYADFEGVDELKGMCTHYPARACASKGLCDRLWCLLYINLQKKFKLFFYLSKYSL